MTTRLLLFFAVLPLVSCVWNSSVSELPNNTLQVSATATPSRGDKNAVRDMAKALAAEHCATLEKVPQIIEVETSPSGRNNTVATATFTCR